MRGEHVFSDSNGQRLNNLQGPWKRWQFVHKKLTIRYREPYQMRHTSVTWNLMIGKNVLWVAKNHGHSTEVMLKTYAKWLEGSTKDDIALIEAAMGTRWAPELREKSGLVKSNNGLGWRRESPPKRSFTPFHACSNPPVFPLRLIISLFSMCLAVSLHPT